MDELNQAYKNWLQDINEETTHKLLHIILDTLGVIELYQEYTKYRLFYDNDVLNVEKVEDFLFAQFVMDEEFLQGDNNE